MSNTIFGKIRLLTLGNIHQLLNKLIDLNSIAEVEQHLRDLNAAFKDLDESSAEAEGRKRWLKKQVVSKQGEKKGIDEAILTILSDGNPDNDHLTKAMGVRAVGIADMIHDLEAELVEATETDAMIDNAVSQLNSRIESLGGKLAGLRMRDAAAKSKEKAASALYNASSTVAGGSGLNVDDVETRIEQRDEIATVKLERALGTMNVAVNGDEQVARGDSYIEQLKASMAEKK